MQCVVHEGCDWEGGTALRSGIVAAAKRCRVVICAVQVDLLYCSRRMQARQQLVCILSRRRHTLPSASLCSQDGSGTLTADEVAEAMGCTGRMSGALGRAV